MVETDLDYPIPNRIPAVPVKEIPTDKDVLAARPALKFCLSKVAGMFYCRTSLTQEVWDKSAVVVKDLVQKTRESKKTRWWIGGSLDMWWDLHASFSLAVPALKSQSFFPVSSNETTSVTAFMCSNASTLLRDLELVNDLVVLSRNLLYRNVAAQNYAAESGFDQKILQLLEICTRVTARSMDCDPANGQDRTHAEITARYKILLVSCLQFMHNAVNGNEARKLSLWIDLFGHAMESPLGSNSSLSQPLTKPEGLGFKYHTVFDYTPDPEWDPTETFPRLKNIMRALRAVHLVSLRDDEEDKRLAADFSRRSETLLSDLDDATDKNNARKPEVLKFFRDILSPDEYKEGPTRDKSYMPLDSRIELHKRKKRSLVKEVPVRFPELDSPVESAQETQPQANGLEEPLQATHISSETNGASSDSQIPDNADSASNVAVHEDDHDDDEDDEDDEDDYEDESEPEDDYDPYAASYKQHGILAEIPLILSPPEAEPLILIINNGVVPPRNATHGSDAYPNENQVFQALRCNLLIFSDQGRHLLKEMLIYVAAWDLSEDHIYFKLLINLVNAIVADGYLMLAYNNFREAKDVVSPAQQSLIKMLTVIFRKNKEQGPPYSPARDCDEDEVPARLQRDRTVVYDMVAEFRTHVIPRTIAYIWLQGKIREQAAIPEDFPLNLWDVERIYEGVYQFIEFFAVLAETPTWKRILVQQDLSFELIELLRVLDASIPKVPLESHRLDTDVDGPWSPDERPPHPPPPPAAPANGASPAGGPAGPVPVAVERPFDTTVESPTTAAPASPPDHEGPPPEILDAWKYEWRNLKKLVILCLSSLIWQTPRVKQQVRDQGGVELIMGCCTIDENNPFIKEHALLCLQFMVEESAEKLTSGQLAEDLAARAAARAREMEEK